jgi:hypothetical protein
MGAVGSHAPYSPLRGLRNDNDPIQGGRAEVLNHAQHLAVSPGLIDLYFGTPHLNQELDILRR